MKIDLGTTSTDKLNMLKKTLGGQVAYEVVAQQELEEEKMNKVEPKACE